MNSLIATYFPHLNDRQLDKFEQLQYIYSFWNSKINLISRKDIDSLYLKHILHSLGIAKVEQFLPNSKVMDVGTGGGLPGIPLAIVFPETQFLLVDSIGKKIRVVEEIKNILDLKNIETHHSRAEDMTAKVDFVVSRAVTQIPIFVKWVQSSFKTTSKHTHKNGILYLKGGDFKEETKGVKKVQVYNLSSYFENAFFETKKILYIPMV